MCQLFQVIQDAKYLHPKEHDDRKAVDAVDRLTEEVFNGLGETMVEKIIAKKTSKFDLCDVVKKEFQEFQIETMPDDFSSKDESSLKAALSRPSYWAACYDQYGICSDQQPAVNVDVESYWRKVSTFLLDKIS